MAPGLVSLSTRPIHSQLHDARKAAGKLVEVYERLCVQIQNNEVSTVVTATSIASGGTYDAKTLITRGKKEAEEKIHALVQGSLCVTECSEAEKANLRLEPLHTWGEATDRARKHVRKLTKYFGEEHDY